MAHIVLGLTVFALTLLRILWWVAFDKKPQPVAGQPGWQELLAKIVHGLLYVILLLMASSGISDAGAVGRDPGAVVQGAGAGFRWG